MISNSATSQPHPQACGFAPRCTPTRTSARDIFILSYVFVASALFAAIVVYVTVAFEQHRLASPPPASAVPALFEPMQEQGFAACVVAGVCHTSGAHFNN